jgi:hypothetical protein
MVSSSTGRFGPLYYNNARKNVTKYETNVFAPLHSQSTGADKPETLSGKNGTKISQKDAIVLLQTSASLF